jgi:hypothetical protein
MPHIASRALKVFYCLVLISAVLPIGLASSSWVAMAKGPSMLGGSFVFLLLGCYRVYLVAKLPRTIDSLKTTGVSEFLRRVGLAGIYFGGFVAVLNILTGPLMRLFMNSRTGSGAEFFAAGVYLNFLGGLGILGLLCFELSRLLAFEQQWRKVSK